MTQAYKGVVIVHGSADLYNCPLEFDRMARRFPKVPLLMAHCGFFWEWELAIELGATKVIWGTDGPFCDYEWEFNKIKRYAKCEHDFDLMIGGNIANLLEIQ